MVAGRIQQYVYDNTIKLSREEQLAVRKKVEQEMQDPRNEIADFLTKRPEITFFRSVYHQYSPFAIENIAHELTGSVGYGNLASCDIRHGKADLMWRMYLELKVTAVNSDGNDNYTPPGVGFRLIKYVSITISGEEIDRQYSQWMELWSKISVDSSVGPGYRNLVEGYTHNIQDLTDEETAKFSEEGDVVYVPLQFWFCQHPGLALPLSALNTGIIHLKIQFAKRWAGAPDAFAGRLWIDHVYASGTEKKRIMNNSLKKSYLIEQVQTANNRPTSVTIPSDQETVDTTITFQMNHPVKQIIWGVWHPDPDDNNKGDWVRTIRSACLKLDGAKRFEPRSGEYFRLVQPFQHNTSVPSNNPTYAYSFALDPEDCSPTGFADFTSFDTSSLDLTIAKPEGITDSVTLQVWVFALSYNRLTFLNNSAGLDFKT